MGAKLFDDDHNHIKILLFDENINQLLLILYIKINSNIEYIFQMFLHKNKENKLLKHKYNTKQEYFICHAEKYINIFSILY